MAEPSRRSIALTPYEFSDKDNFVGREWECDQLYTLLLAERIVVLYAPSGAGKTSLVQAGLIPRLDDLMQVDTRPIRVGVAPAVSGPTGAHYNRYILSAIDSLDDQAPDERKLTLAPPAAATSLVEYVAWRYGDHGVPVLLIFDQFEEILTVDPHNSAARREFFSQLGTVLQNARFCALLVLREDYTAGIEPYLSVIPKRSLARYRLDLLDRDSAVQVLLKMAANDGLRLSEVDATQLAADLSTIQILDAEGNLQAQPGQYVEPVQLKAVYQRLLLTPDRAETFSYGRSQVDAALRDFYEQRLAEVLASSALADLDHTGLESRIRTWISEQLISREGLRMQVRSDDGASEIAGLDRRVVDQLKEAYLLRYEHRQGRVWIELSHDRLVQPILMANRERLKAEQRGVNLAVLGWALIFPSSAEKPEDTRRTALYGALQPLLALRKEEAGSRYAELLGYDGFRAQNDTIDDVIGRLRRQTGGSLPYYVLLVGTPQQIPFEFQYALARQCAVGRITFERVEEYERYTRHVADAQKHSPRPKPAAGFMCAAYDGDTETMYRDLMQPLVHHAQTTNREWRYHTLFAEQAGKIDLSLLLARETLDLLVAAGRGYQFGDAPEQLGNLVCNDWVRNQAERADKQFAPEDCFGVDDLPFYSLNGMIALLISGYSAGNSAGELRDRSNQLRQVPAAVSSLAQGLLAHPSGGALAVIGHVDENYDYAYYNYSYGIKATTFEVVQTKKSDITLFASVLDALMQGQTVGKAMAAFGPEVAALISTYAEEVLKIVEQIDLGREEYEYFVSNILKLREIFQRPQLRDLRQYIIIGDPAVRLPIA